MTGIAILLFCIFTFLGCVHFYWALGGEWGFANSLPTNENGEKMLSPGKAASVVVGFGLLAFGFFYLIRAELIIVPLPDWIFKIVGWLIPVIFLLRAVGDFKYVGFFKKVKETKFGQTDTKIYSPLCLGLGMLALILQLMQ